MKHSDRTRRWWLLAILLGGCVEQNADTPSETDLEAARANILAQAPSPQFPVHADLEGQIEVLGCDVEPKVVEPGKPVTVTTYLKVNRQMVGGWRLFFHINGAGRSQYGNHDHKPLGGKYPVSAWKAGEILRDVYRFTVPARFSGPELNLYTGLWRGTERMRVTSGPQDGENRVHLAKLAVQSGAQTNAAAPARKRYIARRIGKAPKLDGDLDEAAWKEAAQTEPFVTTLTGDAAPQKTTAQMIYDDKFLYLAFRNEDTDVWSSLGKHDDKLWTEEAVEVMIDADGDGKTYIELQVNPAGATFDSYLPTYRQNQNDWESGLKAAVKVDGTRNRRDDRDRGWTVEMALPLGSVKGRATSALRIPPAVGDRWRINLYRMDLPKGASQVGTGWVPPRVADFHALDKFGELVFGDEKGQVPEDLRQNSAGEDPRKMDAPASASPPKRRLKSSKPRAAAPQ